MKTLTVLLLWLLSLSRIVAADVTLAWDANAEPDLEGYKLHVGIESFTTGKAVQILDVGKVTQYQVGGLTYGTPYFFVATAYNSVNQDSGYSNEVTYTPILPVEDQIKYWPRVNANGRMNGGSFEAGPSRNGPWTKLSWCKWWPSYAGETITLPVGTLAKYKAFRYLASQSWNPIPWGSVAEIEFIQNGKKITGTVFGTPGSFGNYGATVEKAFDGNIMTYWDAPDWALTNHAGVERP